MITRSRSGQVNVPSAGTPNKIENLPSASGTNSVPPKRKPIRNSTAEKKKRKIGEETAKDYNKKGNLPNLSVVVQNCLSQEQKEELKNNSQEKEVQTDLVAPTASKELEILEKIENALGRHYMDSAARLQLNREPNCYRQLDKCSKLHSFSKEPDLILHKADIYWQSNVQRLLIEHQFTLFLKCLSDMNCEQIFPGDGVLRSVFELILTINEQPEDDKAYTSEHVIQQCVNIFEDVMQVFPPCWHAVKSEYLKVLSNSIQVENMQKYGCENGIFYVCLSVLEDCLENGEDNVNNNGSEGPNNAAYYLDDYFSWEEQNTQKLDFSKHKREEKLDRVFIVLNLLIKLMENDLCMWMRKHPKNFLRNTKNIFKKPLIVSLIWSVNDMNGEINYNIKNILTIFVDCVALGFPASKIEILSRLINLIAVAINIFEMCSTDSILFPCVKDQIQCLVKEIKLKIEKSVFYDLQLYMRVIECIRSPMVKMCLVDALLNKLNRDPIPLSLKKIFLNFRKQRWLECECKVEESKSCNSYPKAAARSKYPLAIKTDKITKQNHMFRDDYLRMQLLCFQSYLEVYRIHECFQISDQSCGTLKPNLKQEEIKSTFDFDEIDKQLKEMLLNSNIHSTTLFISKTTELIFRDIDINAINYREDMKYFLFMVDLMTVYRKTFGNVFDNWITYISKLNVNEVYRNCSK